MTAEEWKNCEKRLSGYSGTVYLKADEYNLTLAVVPIKKLKQAIMIYIDEKFKMEWLIADCEIRRRFCNEHKKCFYSQAEMKKIKRMGKETCEKLLEKAYYYWYEPYWHSFRSLKSHLIKNNNSIELVDRVNPRTKIEISGGTNERQASDRKA